MFYIMMSHHADIVNNFTLRFTLRYDITIYFVFYRVPDYIKIIYPWPKTIIMWPNLNRPYP